MAAGAVSLKKPHHIITLRFSEVLKVHAMFFVLFAFVNLTLLQFFGSWFNVQYFLYIQNIYSISTSVFF